jgi:uncharacterized membrane protein YgaE (UPF0421/DUF939 family)
MEDQRGVREAIRMDRDVRALTRGIQLALRPAVAAGSSLATAELLNLKCPTIYALIAAVIVTDLSPSQTSKLGLQRSAATVVGATCGATLHHVLKPSL